MEHYIGKIKGAVIAIGTLITSIFGALAIPVCLLVAGNIIDYTTGLMAAGNRGQSRSSNKGFDGIKKKISMWLLVVVGGLVDVLLAYVLNQWGIQPPISFAVGCLAAIWLFCNELISIIENVSDMGVSVPFLMPIVRWVKGKAESKVDIPEENEKENAQ